MNNKDSGTIYFLAGMLFGGLVGAGIGILVAPDSGDKTLAKLKKSGEKAVKSSIKAVDEFQQKELQPKIKDAKVQLEKKFTDFNKKELQPKIKDAKDQLERKFNEFQGKKAEK